MERPDRFGDDPILFTIDAGNVTYGFPESRG